MHRQLCKTWIPLEKIFKARYYPHSSYLEAMKGSNPSYIWSSIQRCRTLSVLIVNRGWVMGGRFKYGINHGYQISQTLLLRQKCLATWKGLRSLICSMKKGSQFFLNIEGAHFR